MSEYPTYEVPPSKEAEVAVPYEELEREEWERMAVAAEQNTCQIVGENQISKWYKWVLPSRYIPILRNAGPCSAAQIIDTEGNTALAHFTPDIDAETIRKLMDGRQIQQGKILIPMKPSALFVPAHFRKKVEFFRTLGLTPVMPKYIDDKGLPTVVNMLMDAENHRVVSGITYDASFPNMVPHYKAAFTE